jgi:hypothetical protein
MRPVEVKAGFGIESLHRAHNGFGGIPYRRARLPCAASATARARARWCST